MELIERIQAIVPAPLILYFCPLLILACFMLAFEYWLRRGWRIAGAIYAISLITGWLAAQMTALSEFEITLTGGLLAPAIGSILWLFYGAAQALRLPYPGRFSPGRPQESLRLPERLGRAAIGGGVGSVIGVSIGILMSAASLALMRLLGSAAIATSDLTTLLRVVFDISIYLFGALGLGLGILAGLGRLPVQRLGERLLIYAVICSAISAGLLRQILRIPQLSRLLQWHSSVDQNVGTGMRQGQPSTSTKTATHTRAVDSDWHTLTQPRPDGLEVIEREHTLTLRYRTYRSVDWVWIGFNGLYDGFVLIVVAIALWRGTWAVMAWGISLLLIVAASWTWHSLTLLFNYTTITLSPMGLRRHDAPLLSLAVRLSIPLQRIAEIRALATDSGFSSASQSPAAYSEYHVYALLTDGKRIPLLKRLDQWEEAVFVETKLARFRARRSI
jgi:ABC-type multidrug transport system fused ATPase/permease subunit